MAQDNVNKFSALQNSQASFELQQQYQIGVYGISSIQNLKLLAGSEYANRIEIELNVQYEYTAEVDTLRIDEAQIEIINDK